LLVLDIQEIIRRSGRNPPSPEVCDRLVDTINSLSQVASSFGIMVLYVDNERARVAATLFSRLQTKKLDGNSNKRLKMVSGHSFTKRGRDAFSNVKLDGVLRKYGIDHLFLAGLDGATSIKQTARSALDLGYRVTFIQDGIFTAFESKWERALKDFESAAAFAISSHEFNEFATAAHQASGAHRRPLEEV
jgi:nicotinamidase-related amidase